MVEVEVDGEDIDRGALMDRIAQVQSWFVWSPHARKGAIPIFFTREPHRAFFTIHRVHGVEVSTWQSDGLARYAGIDRNGYLALCALLGLAQWRALTLNTCLREEDFWHPGYADCLYAMPESREEGALLFEHPQVCSGCVAFLRCLGVEPEMAAIEEALHHLFGARVVRGVVGRTNRRRFARVSVPYL